MNKIKRGKYWAIRVGKDYVFEHRLVMEKKIGRPLTSEECVDHIDRNPENNSPYNLRLFSTHGQHTKIAHPEIREEQKITFKGKRFSTKSEWKKGDPRLIGNTWNKGRSSWNKGKEWSAEHKAKLRVSHIGKHTVNSSSFKKGMVPWNKGKRMK